MKKVKAQIFGLKGRKGKLRPQVQSEAIQKVDTLGRNGWRPCSGTGGYLGPERLATLVRNMLRASLSYKLQGFRAKLAHIHGWSVLLSITKMRKNNY